MKKWHWAVLALLTIVSILVEFTMHHDETHGSHWWTSIPLFWIWFGFIGCVLLIVFAKFLMAPFIYKKEDYYHE
jgi:hypothetical protein